MLCIHSDPRYQALLTWKKNNPGASYEDLAEAFRRAGRADMVDVTYQVADNPSIPPQTQKSRVPSGGLKSKICSKKTLQ